MAKGSGKKQKQETEVENKGLDSTMLPPTDSIEPEGAETTTTEDIEEGAGEELAPESTEPEVEPEPEVSPLVSPEPEPKAKPADDTGMVRVIVTNGCIKNNGKYFSKGTSLLIRATDVERLVELDRVKKL